MRASKYCCKFDCFLVADELAKENGKTVKTPDFMQRCILILLTRNFKETNEAIFTYYY